MSSLPRWGKCSCCGILPGMEELKPTHAGGVVLGDGGTVALVHNAETGTWTFPKGSIETGETDEEAALREIEEETSLTGLEFIGDLGTYTRTKGGREGAEQKVLHIFLYAAPRGAALTPANEIAEAVWVPYREVAAKLNIDKDRAWYASVFDRVREAIQRD